MNNASTSVCMRARRRLYCRDDVIAAERGDIYSIISSGQDRKKYKKNIIDLSEIVHVIRVSFCGHVHVCYVVICSLRLYP